jgi:S1-C subfamily serine protease
MIPDSVIQSVSNGTCALGILHDLNSTLGEIKNKDFTIIGTGFLVRSNTILTNRHVVQAITRKMDKLRLPNPHGRAQFSYPFDDGMEQYFAEVTKVAVLNEPHLDVALLQFDRPKDMPTFESNVKPLSAVKSVLDLKLGEPVGVMGFPYGNRLHVDQRVDPEAIARVGPILQQGFISGFQPWGGATRMRELLLDVRTYKGMSGSPVFRQDTGQVIGLHYAGTGHTVVAKSIPVDSVRLPVWIGMLDNPGQPGVVKYD